jgi:tRNA-binding protein
MAKPITWEDFDKVEMRVGEVLEVEPYPEGHRPSYLLRIDFGERIGEKTSIAAIRDQYQPEDLSGRQVIAVVNFPPIQIGVRRSHALVLAAVEESGALHLVRPDDGAPLGARVR